MLLVSLELEEIRSLSDRVLVISDGRSPDWPEANRLCAGGGAGFRVVCFRPDPYSTKGEAEIQANTPPKLMLIRPR